MRLLFWYAWFFLAGATAAYAQFNPYWWIIAVNLVLIALVRTFLRWRDA